MNANDDDAARALAYAWKVFVDPDFEQYKWEARQKYTGRNDCFQARKEARMTIRAVILKRSVSGQNFSAGQIGLAHAAGLNGPKADYGFVAMTNDGKTVVNVVAIEQVMKNLEHVRPMQGSDGSLYYWLEPDGQPSPSMLQRGGRFDPDEPF